MTTRPPKDVAASVRARLLNLSKRTGEEFPFLLRRYAIERFLYRLGESRHRKRFVLKGAMLYNLWSSSVYRPTRDLDLAGYGSHETDDILAALRGVCTLPVVDDGVTFLVETFAAEPIRIDSEYHGLRVKFRAELAAARIPIQIDIGFGNAIEPPAAEVDYPAILDTPEPRIRASPQEAVIAEKFNAMVVLGTLNTRYKDFYDLHALPGHFPFEGERLARAVKATFERRHTPIGARIPAALTPGFYTDAARADQWKNYLTRNSLPGVPSEFAKVGEVIQAFLGPLWRTLARKAPFDQQWEPGGLWQSAEAKDEGAP